jgi:hypothetical protein
MYESKLGTQREKNLQKNWRSPKTKTKTKASSTKTKSRRKNYPKKEKSTIFRQLSISRN